MKIVRLNETYNFKVHNFFIRTRLSAKTIDPAFRSTNINMELVSIIVTNMTSGKKKHVNYKVVDPTINKYLYKFHLHMRPYEKVMIFEIYYVIE